MTNPMQANEFFYHMAGKAMEACSLWADANQRVLRELVDLSASVAKEGVGLYSEFQSSAMEAFKDSQARLLPRPGEMRDGPKDAFSCYQKNALESVTEVTQKTFKLFEGSTQAMTRSAERVQVTSERAAKEIQGTIAQLAGRMEVTLQSRRLTTCCPGHVGFPSQLKGHHLRRSLDGRTQERERWARPSRGILETKGGPIAVPV